MGCLEHSRRVWLPLGCYARTSVLGLVLALSLPGSLLAQDPGDANDDGNVDFGDVPIILDEILLRGVAPGDPDCTQDALVDVLDVICVRRHVLNTGPTADAGPDVSVELGQTAYLDGTSSSDPEADPLAFQWTILSAPSGSVATLAAEQGATPLLVPDLVGTYQVEVTVDDGLMSSDDLVEVTAETPLTVITSSPAAGEDDVAITRETIVFFSNALDPATNITSADLFAEFAGQMLPGRIHLAPNLRSVTLFYDQPLPASARVRVTFVGDGVIDGDGQAVDADGDGQPGGTGSFDFDTVTFTLLEGTSVCGRVFASELDDGGGMPMNTPLEEVTISVDTLEEEAFAVTDIMGDFCLDPAPSGVFFVHIDGHTTTTTTIPPGSYYPTVGKAWQSVPGQETNIGSIFLPLIVDGTLQPTSQVSDTEITFPAAVTDEFPELAGTLLTVPADSLYADDGTRGGEVGIAPVAPDRLPGQLPPGLDLPLVITVQTDGATNFDEPVPICFPNLNSPVTGLRQAPAGAKSALWSFNHDIGRFEVVGSTTVSNDLSQVCTDPGVGIRAPGWHGDAQGALCTGGLILEESDDPEAPDTCVFSSGSGGALAETQTAADVLVLAGIPQSASTLPTCPEIERIDYSYHSCTIVRTDRPYDPEEMCCAPNGVGPVARYPVENLAHCPGRVSTGLPLPPPNGCGSDWIGAVGDFIGLDRNSPADADFEPACAIHDDCYATFSTDPGHKLACDEQFFVGLQAACSNTFPPGEALETCLSWALNYFQIVDSGGQSAYDAAQAVASLCCPFPGTSSQMQVTATAIPQLPLGSAESTALLGDPDQILRPSTGLHYFAIQDRFEGQMVLRGKAGSNGIAHDRVNLPPDTLFRHWLLDAENLFIGFSEFTTPGSGEGIELPPTLLEPPTGPDSDLDGLSDDGELIMGTNANVSDSDSDGIPDGPEVLQGTNPSDGLPVITGVVASVDTPGIAVDVAARDAVAVVADSGAGISMFNVFNGINPPLVVAQVDTPGGALAVAIDGNRVAVADGASGLAVVDISDPPSASIERQVALGGSAQAVAAGGGIAYLGTTSGAVSAVDLATGAVLGSLDLGAPVQDVGLGKETIYALTAGNLQAITIAGGQYELATTVASPGAVSTGGRRLRLFVGDEVLYAVHSQGYNTFDISTPDQPSLITAGTTAQFGWKQIVDNGSGIGIATVSPNGTDDGPHHVSMYNVSNPSLADVFIAEFTTPGLATAVTIFNGLAYVADGAAGLQVINYLAYDSLGLPPTITLTTNFAAGSAEEGQIMRVTAQVADDVQVRNVEFYVDGELLATDGNFPFEVRFPVPPLSQQSSFTLQGRATDTGGNATWTPLEVVNVTADATPPTITRVLPTDGSKRGGTSSVTAFFSEVIDSTTLNGVSFSVVEAGTDEILGTTDDVDVTGHIEFLSDLLAAVMTFSPELGFGVYRATLSSSITDVAGNGLANPQTWDFELAELSTVAETGTPADQFLPSANVGQTITIEGSGFTGATQVTFPTRNSSGTVGSEPVTMTNVAPDGTSGDVVVPERAETGTVLVPGGFDSFLQIVPRVTGIANGGPGRVANIAGSGFIEGFTTVRFGAVQVVDAGPFTNDGIDVRDIGGLNAQLDVTVPPDGRLPYEVITAGGSSGRSTDLDTIPTVADTGTPANAAEASANVGQQVTFEGTGYDATTEIVLEAINASGTPFIIAVAQDSVAVDGSTVTFTVPERARSGPASILNGGAGRLLQIVPRVTGIANGGPGRVANIAGSGFSEAFVTVRFGAEQVVDGGPFTNDGIDVRDIGGLNAQLDVTVPANGTLPYEVITEGGSSGRATDLDTIPTVSDTGTPANVAEASANVGQQVTFEGTGYDATTEIVLEAMPQFGTPFIITVNQDSVAVDGSTVTFTVPAQARAGQASILNGGASQLLQIVPRVTGITNGGPGRPVVLEGTGFIEGFITVRFGAEQVVDGGPFTNDGVNVRDIGGQNSYLDVTVTAAGTLPYEVITEGGSSGRAADVASFTAAATIGTPATGAEASANVGQVITVNGAGYDGNTKVVLEAMNSAGTPFIITVDQDSVVPDGSSLTFTVPAQARAGQASILNGGASQLLQIVPTLATASSATPGQSSVLIGTGFIEGFITIHFGGASVVDGGPFTNDGVDVQDVGGQNTRANTVVPTGGSNPVSVTTEGGTSNGVNP